MENTLKLGINGLGRIGKMSLWYHIAHKHFDEIVVNVGREVGTSLQDVVSYIEKDSTYGHLKNYLYGYNAGKIVEEVDEKDRSMVVDGVKVKFLMKDRNPRDIGWADHGVDLVVEATGQFLDPTLPGDAPKGSCRGHLDAGARKVVVSAPFKIKDKAKSIPDDALTTVMGVNDHRYDPSRHVIVSNASCTTNCLAHMMKPLIDSFGVKRLLTASMATVHAMTGSQPVLDRLPKGGDTDLRKNRSVLDNIILTSTGAAKALALVIPEMKSIGFMAESVRVPLATGSLIILVVNIQERQEEEVRRETVNTIYREAAAGDPHGYLRYTDHQNVSRDIVAHEGATALIEGHETHTRTAMATVDLVNIKGFPADILAQLPDTRVEIPITQVVVYGWYDNELGSFVRMLGERTISVAQSMVD